MEKSDKVARDGLHFCFDTQLYSKIKFQVNRKFFFVFDETECHDLLNQPDGINASHLICYAILVNHTANDPAEINLNETANEAVIVFGTAQPPPINIPQ